MIRCNKTPLESVQESCSYSETNLLFILEGKEVMATPFILNFKLNFQKNLRLNAEAEKRHMAISSCMKIKILEITFEIWDKDGFLMNYLETDLVSSKILTCFE